MSAERIDTAALKSEFARLFQPGGKTHIVRAPGRVNLIGEHTDYNDGFVLPMAIERAVYVVCRAREDGRVRLASTAFQGDLVEFSIQEKIQRGQPQWANYGRGMAAELLAAGMPLVGMDALVTNTLPVGGGLSSSAAILVGIGLALLTVEGLTIDPSRLALIAQKAEHEYAGVPSGIMDQSISAGAKAGHAMLLDTRDLTRQFIPIDANDVKVVVANSMVKHDHSASEYAVRRKQCESGVEHFRRHNPNIKALRDVSMTMLEAAKANLDEVVYRRCRHVITENTRTLDFATQITKKNYQQVGLDMLASHESLAADYEVSSPELDFLVAQSMQVNGVYGARMTGGGFGGCIVALAQPRVVDQLSETLNKMYSAEFKKQPDIFITNPTAGASVIE